MLPLPDDTSVPDRRVSSDIKFSAGVVIRYNVPANRAGIPNNFYVACKFCNPIFNDSGRTERISVLPASTGSEYRGLSGNSRSTGHRRHVANERVFRRAQHTSKAEPQYSSYCSWHRLSDADSYQRSVKIAQIDASINKRLKRTKRSPMGALITQNIARHRASKIQLGLVYIDEISKNTAATRKLSAP